MYNLLLVIVQCVLLVHVARVLAYAAGLGSPSWSLISRHGLKRMSQSHSASVSIVHFYCKQGLNVLHMRKEFKFTKCNAQSMHSPVLSYLFWPFFPTSCRMLLVHHLCQIPSVSASLPFWSLHWHHWEQRLASFYWLLWRSCGAVGNVTVGITAFTFSWKLLGRLLVSLLPLASEFPAGATCLAKVEQN